jgi:hypothetical protein
MVSELGMDFSGDCTALHGQCHLRCRKERYEQFGRRCSIVLDAKGALVQ